ncbi:hypothetical protein EV714DRAFT_244590, partial [Schizophyllum commune]
MRCAHPCAHSVLHALHTLALSPSFFWISESLRSLELLDSDSRNGDDGRRVIHRRVRPLALLCLLTASPNTGKRLPLDEFVALDIRLRLGVLARP